MDTRLLLVERCLGLLGKLLCLKSKSTCVRYNLVEDEDDTFFVEVNVFDTDSYEIRHDVSCRYCCCCSDIF